jgi:hypothetical protein
MPNYSQVQLLRGQGKTFQEIANIYSVTRQRVHTIFTGYRLTDAYKERKRHNEYHTLPGASPRKKCSLCKEIN